MADDDLDRLMPAAIPVSVITGFLGSGKTTLINRLLRQPAMAETAVLINEFGEIGIDHLLVEKVDDNIVLLDSGCICCSVSGELVDSMRKLFARRILGEVPPYRRVLIETTGLADPAPVLHALMSSIHLADRYTLDGVVTTVDAALGAGQLDRHAEPVKQAAIADCLVLTKTDLAEAGPMAALESRLRALNPNARRLRAARGQVEADALFGFGPWADGTADLRRWMGAPPRSAIPARSSGHDHDHDHDHAHHAPAGPHDDSIGTFSLTAEEPLDWDRFATWLTQLLAEHGEKMLRVKGLLNVAGVEGPVVVHGVQHIFHPAAQLPSWPDADRRSRLVFITRDVPRDGIEAGFRRVIAGP